MLKILITGGNGFVAKNLKELLPTDLYQLDVKNSTELNLLHTESVQSILKNNLYDVVIHTANYDAANPHNNKNSALVLDTNLRMYFNLVRCSEYYGKLIYYGSGAEFDRSHWKLGMDQTYFDSYVPSDPYGLSKYIMTKYALNSKNIYNLRLYSVFGKYEDNRIRFISKACCQTIIDQPITIYQNAIYDYIDVSDVVSITKWFIENSPNNKVYDVCTGIPNDLVSIANKVLTVSKKSIPINLMQTGVGSYYSGNNTLLKQTIPNLTFINIDKSIELLYNWYRDEQL